MNLTVMREITPLTETDCFLVFSRVKPNFSFPLHVHGVYELNFIQNAKGAQRIVGDSIETIDDLELTLITSPTLEHTWLDHECKSEEIKEITIQFQAEMLGSGMLKKNSFKTIEKLFERAKQGVTFSRETIESVLPQLDALTENTKGISPVLHFIFLLHKLSISPNQRMLATSNGVDRAFHFESRRIEKLYAYLEENYINDIRLSHASNLIGMSEVAFCRFFKQRTGKSFIDALNDIRVSHVVRLLTGTTQTISEICYSCGFNNLSNFNRVFLKKKGCTPSQLREDYKQNRILV